MELAAFVMQLRHLDAVPSLARRHRRVLQSRQLRLEAHVAPERRDNLLRGRLRLQQEEVREVVVRRALDPRAAEDLTAAACSGQSIIWQFFYRAQKLQEPF